MKNGKIKGSCWKYLRAFALLFSEVFPTFPPPVPGEKKPFIREGSYFVNKKALKSSKRLFIWMFCFVPRIKAWRRSGIVMS